MNQIKENIIKFIDEMIAEKYKTAHNTLGIVIEEKIKRLIAEASKKSHPFKKKKTVEDKSTGKKYKKTKAFGNRKQTKAEKMKNKVLPRKLKHKKEAEKE